jgi:hypothetical protein
MKSSNGKGRKAYKQFHADLLLKLEMRSNPEALGLVRATLERAAEALNFHSVERRAIVRSVDEALANVMRHAYEGKSGLPIVVTFRRLYGHNHCSEPIKTEGAPTRGHQAGGPGAAFHATKHGRGGIQPETWKESTSYGEVFGHTKDRIGVSRRIDRADCCPRITRWNNSGSLGRY